MVVLNILLVGGMELMNTGTIFYKHLKLKRVLEIGSFEGQTICFISEILTKCDFHCIDSWQGDEMLSKQFDFKTIEKNLIIISFLQKKNNPNHNFFKYKKILQTTF